ncbi:hypothetical protein [Maricaulis sp.]|uniref:hypothetical protein n=1 Tax=Maricaulis sp. TaxID=1486257 RepID=UPI003A953A4F
MKKSMLTMLLAGTAIVMAGTAAQAQPGRGHDGPGRHGGGAERGAMMLRLADANGDNSVTQAEVDALQAEMFEWMDRNGDGYLDEADQSPIRQRMRDMREARADDGDRPDGEGRRRMGRGGERGERGDRGGRGERGPRDADTDGDNRVSRAEFLAVEHRGFARLDADSNGVITPEELDAAADERHDRRRWWRN